MLRPADSHGVTGGPAAGWYDDGATTGVVRWFDGTAWTEHTRPTDVPVAEIAFAPVAPMPTVFAPPSAVGAAYSPVPTHAPGQQPPFGAEPSRFAAYGAAPAFGAEPSPFGPYGVQPARADFGASGFGGAGYTTLPGRLVDQGAIDHARRRVYRDFWFGIGWLLLGALIASWVAASISAAGGYGYGRHYVSTAGVVGGLLSLYRARKSYKAMVSLGGQPWSSSSIALAGLGAGTAVLLSAVAIVHAYTATGSPGMAAPDAGSCWAEAGDSVWQVSCEVPHSYSASARISNGMVCPNPEDHLVALSDDSGEALCLTPLDPGSLG